MVVVSMAIINSRVQNVPIIIKNLEEQTKKPDKILLYYSKTPWHHDTGIKNLEIPKTNLDVEIIEVPNYGSCRKYLFSIERYRKTNASILLLDDDIIFDHKTIEILCAYQNNNMRVVATRGWSEFTIINKNGEDVFERSPHFTITGGKIYKPTQVTVTSSGWATLFFAKDVQKEIFDTKLQKSIQLKYSDEIFLSTMLPPEKFIVPFSRTFYQKLNASTALCKAPETLRAKALQAKLLQKKLEEKQISA